MRKALKLGVLILFIFTGGLYFSHASFAYSPDIVREVLGVTDDASENIIIPPTAEGPGLILPDSPLFFLDRLKQNVRILLALSPEEKAKVYASVAGERYAELRFMLARNNTVQAQKSILEVTENFQNASIQVSRAKFDGKNVEKLAKDINDSIKAKQDIVELLEGSGGGIGGSAKIASGFLMESKARVEDSLNPSDLDNEIRDDLIRLARINSQGASVSAAHLNKALEALNQEASKSAAESLKNREEALKKAIDAKNQELIATQQKLLEEEKRQQEEKIRLSDSQIKEVKLLVEQAQKAAAAFEAKKTSLTTSPSAPAAR